LPASIDRERQIIPFRIIRAGFDRVHVETGRATDRHISWDVAASEAGDFNVVSLWSNGTLTAQQKWLDNVSGGAPGEKAAPGYADSPSAWTAGFQLKGSGWYATDFKAVQAPPQPAQMAMTARPRQPPRLRRLRSNLLIRLQPPALRLVPPLVLVTEAAFSGISLFA
jgi:hypothetical protein